MMKIGEGLFIEKNESKSFRKSQVREVQDNKAAWSGSGDLLQAQS